MGLLEQVASIRRRPRSNFERALRPAADVVNRSINRKDGRVLEVACGTGLFSRLIDCSSYHGLDISPAAIDIAQKKFSETASSGTQTTRTYEAADIHDWATPSESFDLAVCVDAVAYFSDQEFALQRMAHSLRKSGRLVLTTINPFVYRRIRRTAERPLREGSISQWLSRSELHALVDASGFTLERSWTIIPRGNMGILRVVNARRLDAAVGQRGAAVLKKWREMAGLGQYRMIVARKKD